MAVSIGTHFGTYEIVAQIGAGGMGEVYKAHDTKLGRDVAIKVLPSAFVNDPERLARFQREARMLASLNHPNIATIHGLEQSNGTHFLIMELVSGETLAERIKREGAVPVEEALKVAIQIAEALEAAHEKGIIHRDLKPANVKVTPEGKVKVLDFGLAKAFAGDATDSNPSQSPTLSAVATMQGVLLGTAAYSFHADKPQLWSPGQFTDLGPGNYNFDPHPDGKRFAVLKISGTGQAAAADKVSFIFNFFDEISRKVPSGNQ
jgi:eukaryotic-like serine/threonine-protein kinase